VPLEFQSRALTWGIIGAVAMRGVMILVGVSAIQRFRWITLLFAGILLASAGKLLFEHDDGDENLSENMIMKLTRSVFQAVDYYDKDHFFTKVGPKSPSVGFSACHVNVH
jgi:tellurite resistance protein TerC